MNKIYNIVWNSSTNQWTVASELAKAQGSAHSQSVSHTLKSITSNLSNVAYKLNRVTASVTLAVIAVFGSSFIATQAQAAECFGVVNSYVSASNGAACDVTGTNYNYIKTYNTGTVANVSAPNVSVYATASSNSATSADNGAVINFAGNLNSTATGNRHSVAIGYEGGAGTINVAGNLTATANAANGRAIFMGGTGSTLNVGGNLVASTTGGGGGSAVVQNDPGTVLNVTGTTQITTTNANPVTGMRLFGTGTLGGAVTVNLASSGRPALHLIGTNQFNSDVTIKTSGVSSVGILQESGSNKIAGNLAITTTGAASSNGINLSGGTLDVTGDTTINTSTDNSIGLSVTGGSFTANNTTINTAGQTAYGVSVSGSGAADFGKLTVNTSGQQAWGVYSNGTNTKTVLGAGSSITTTGYGAIGILAQDTEQFDFASGEVKTSGDYARGIQVVDYTADGMNFTTGANVTTTGVGAEGVALFGSSGGENAIQHTATINGNISTRDASGIIMSGYGGGYTLTTSGNISAGGAFGYGIQVGTLNNTSSNIAITTAAGKTIQADKIGIWANNSGTGTGNISITNNSAISAGDYGIIAQNASKGDTTVQNTAVVTSSTSVGIGATNTNTANAGVVSITSSGHVSGVTGGLVANNAGTGDVQVNSTANATASGSTGRGIEAVQSGSSTGSVMVSTAAGTVVNGGEYGIRAIKNGAGAGAVTVNSAANVLGESYGIAALNSGLGDVTVNSSGTVTAANGLGIYAGSFGNSAATGNINVKVTGDVSGNDGILAGTNNGQGNTNIDVQSNVTTSSGKGIDGETNTGSLSITTIAGKTISARGNAIEASSNTGTTLITNAATLTSSTSNGIDLVNAFGGSTITNSGDITATTAGKFVIAGGNAIETVTTTAGTLTGNTNLGSGNDSFTASGGALIGNTLMGDGDDVATLTGTVDVTAAPQFDGGVGTDVLNVDGLALRGFTAASNDGTGNLTETNNSNLTGWETINVKNAGTLKLSNNLFTTANTGTLNVDATSTLDLKGNSPGVFTIFGDVNNSGMMTMADGAADDLTTITGNYSGVAGSQFAIDTVLGNDSSLTDKLVVNGNTSGTTALSVTNAGGAGAPTVEGIQVVQVDGASDGTFSLAAPVQAGSYEYTLQKNGVSTPTDGDWYLRSTFVATCANTPSLCPVDPVDPVDPPKPPVYIYRPGVALYVTAQSANADAGFLQMSTLHQRMGEQRDLPTDKPQTWGRLIGAGVSNAGGNRFEYDQFTTGFQFGHDLLHKTSSTGTQQRAGVTVQYAHSSMDAKDRVRPLVGLGEDTGSMNSNSVGLGGYYTRMNQAGAYLDVVSQVNHLTNKFSDSYGGNSKQKGWQFGLSAEVGKPVADLGGWKFEPQAQLSYLHTRYDDFTDRYSNIDGLNASQLRGRLGLRVYKDFMVDNKAAQYYGIVNVHHDFLKAKSITLHDRVGTGSASVRESYDRTFGEVGLGIQGQIKNSTHVYADVRYQRSFKGNKQGAQFNVGIKASF